MCYFLGVVTAFDPPVQGYPDRGGRGSRGVGGRDNPVPPRSWYRGVGGRDNAKEFKKYTF
eukprot:5658954-Pyramimonas_sp.AAC.1